MQKNISNSVIRRLPRYYRFLGELEKQGIPRISSRELSERMRVTASQIRQDLNCFGGFGQQGYGYNVTELRGEIARILGLSRAEKMIIIGAGNLGRAISHHIDFGSCGFELVGIFDSDPPEGEEINGVPIMHTDFLDEFCGSEKPSMAALCIPKSGARVIVGRLMALGVSAFWNFSHYDIHYDYPDAAVENVHLNDSLMTLSYAAANRDFFKGETDEPKSEENN